MKNTGLACDLTPQNIRIQTPLNYLRLFLGVASLQNLKITIKKVF